MIPPPVIAAQYTATRKAIEVTGSKPYVKVNPNTTAIDALTPGRAPNITPSTVPKNINTRVLGTNTTSNPIINNSILIPPYISDSRNKAKFLNTPIPLGSIIPNKLLNSTYKVATLTNEDNAKVFILFSPRSREYIMKNISELNTNPK